MAQTRTGHPYYMYDAIRSQPEIWSRVIARECSEAHRLAQVMSGDRRIFLVGTMTSLHAAQVGENMLRAYSGPLDYRAMPAFDFALYPPALTESDDVIVISHRGTKSYSVKAMEVAHGKGCRTILLTGEGPHAVPTPGLADYVLVGSPQEISAGMTMSYTASVAALAVLAQQLGKARHAQPELTDEMLLVTIPRALEAALDTEKQLAGLASMFVNTRHKWIVGGGPAAIAAVETGLKIRETSHLLADGMSTESMIHGPVRSVEANDLFILLAPEGPARGRIMQLGAMLQEIGAPYFVVSDSPQDDPNAKVWIQVPKVPEVFSTMTCVIPMQLFAYHLALCAGRNPDIFRRDDARFTRADAHVKL